MFILFLLLVGKMVHITRAKVTLHARVIVRYSTSFRAVIFNIVRGHFFHLLYNIIILFASIHFSRNVNGDFFKLSNIYILIAIQYFYD